MNANELFKLYPKLNSFHETSDGVKFFTPHDAINHARTLKDKKVTEVFKGDEPETVAVSEGTTEVAKEKKTNPFAAAQLRIDAINAMATEAEVNEALKGEKAKTVLAAGAERIAAIKAAEVDTTADTGAGTEEQTDAASTENTEETK